MNTQRMMQQIDKNWEIYNDSGLRIQANVPGDITADLFKAGEIVDPYYGMNHKELGWIINSDFTYTTHFDISEDILQSDEIFIQFEGIDVFSEIHLNGELLGTTENMFLQYEYNIKDIAKRENNVLSVKMLSTKKKMEEFDTGECWGIFNNERILIRKAQCHFGWDWAPDMPGYGIYKPVWVVGKSKHRIQDVFYRAYNNGWINICAELNYDTAPLTDQYGKPIENIPEYLKEDKLIYKVAERPDEALEQGNYLRYEHKIYGAKNFANFKIDEPKLWWPAGYGKQPLYSYSVELVRNGQVLDKREGKMAFRELRLEQQPISQERLECKLVVNDVPVFAKGSNWVPAECFTGELREEKYRKLLVLAQSGNMNMLRVWGGGIYEDDAFYRICDELGIMIWQDMMFACADIPEERLDFMENVKKEITYQIKRLRNHPAIVLWSGANEKIGSLCKQVSHGDFYLEVIQRGIITNLDDSRPYVRESPFSITNLENDLSSGDTHTSAYEEAIVAGIEDYRDLISKITSSFISECAVMGPGTLDSYKKVFPAEKLWPMNEYWEDRLRGNPYSGVSLNFAEREKKYADTLYGESDSIEAFICKGMTSHAEVMRAELEYARINKGTTWGFMNWMYSDIWPCGTLSVVDYYCEPNQAYYQMKRSFAPVLVTFAQNHEYKTVLGIINDASEKLTGKLEYGLKTLDGEICWKNTLQVNVDENDIVTKEIEEDFKKKNTYLYVRGILNGSEYSNVYSYNMWKDCEFEDDYAYSVEQEDGKLIVTFKANKFAKGIILRLPENEKYIYSDNYFDMEAGEEKQIEIRGFSNVPRAGEIVVTDFHRESIK